MRVRDVMSTDVVTVRPETPFPDLVDALLLHGVSGVPVVDDTGALVGIVTEADLVTKSAYGGHRRRALEVLADLVAGGETSWALKSRGRTAAQVMTANVATVRPQTDLRAASRRMIETGVKRLPVVDDRGHLVGIVSRTDLLRLLHRPDDELRREVERVLADPTRAPETASVEVDVRDGVVSLTGTARFSMDVAVLSSVVWQIPGVVDVRNDVLALAPDPH